MRFCPICRTTYQDPTLNLCPDDGAELQEETVSERSQAIHGGQVAFGADDGLELGPTPQTPQGFNTPVGGVPETEPVAPASKRWLVVILLTLAVAFSVTVAVMDDSGALAGGRGRRDRSLGAGDEDRSPSWKTPDELRGFDFTRWREASTGEAELEINDYSVTSKTTSGRDHHVILVEGTMNSHNRTVSLTVENLENARSSRGYGLVFHSGTPALQLGYAFLVDSVRGEFRIVKHEGKSEQPIVDWRRSDVTWTGPNILQVQDLGERFEFLINGLQVHSMPDAMDVGERRIGIYVSDVKVKFSDLMINK